VTDWSFKWEAHLHDVFPRISDDLSALLARLDDLPVIEPKTRELIRLVCSVATRGPAGIERHAMLARELGAEWEEVLGAIVLTMPALGMQTVVDAIVPARRGFDAAPSPADEPGDDVGDDAGDDAGDDDLTMPSGGDPS
jgi:AhpD family alkylhydroperoxidase